MKLFYVTALLCVVVLKQTYGFRVSFRFTKLNYRHVGSIVIIRVSTSSLERCLESCTTRWYCRGVNYSRMRRFCEVLAYDFDFDVDVNYDNWYQNYDENDRSVNNDTYFDIYNDTGVNIYGRNDVERQISYVFIDHNDMHVTSETDYNKTYMEETAGLLNGTYMYEECETFRLENGTVLGNLLSVGSKVKVVCDENHSIMDGDVILVCQPNRTWSSMPWCIYDCWEPPSKVKGNVSAGPTTNGSVRSYTCFDEFFVSGHRNQTTLNVSCEYGKGWQPEPRCVQDCEEEPKNASELNAESRVDQGIADKDYLNYYCPNGSVVMYMYRRQFYNINGTIHYGFVTHWSLITVQCDGTVPKWRYNNVKCVKKCTEGPPTTNVEKVSYDVDGDTISRTFVCRDGFTVYFEAANIVTDTFTSACNEANGVWTNTNARCINETLMRKNNDDSLPAGEHIFG